MIMFMWISAHIGIKGNKAAELEACKLDKILIILFSKSEAKTIVQNNILKQWQYKWDRDITGRHYYRTQVKVGKWRIGKGNNITEGIITRQRIGHTGLNKTFNLIGKHLTDLCDHCQEDQSVKQVLCHCQTTFQKEKY